MRIVKAAAAISAVAMLSACGSGGDKEETPVTTPSSTATVSPTSTSSSAPAPSASATSTTSSVSKTSTASKTSSPSGTSTKASPTGTKTATATKKATPKPSVTTLAESDLGKSKCTILPATSAKAPSFKIRGVTSNVTKDSSTLTFTFDKNYDPKLFTDEAKKAKANEYGFRVVNASGDNIIYSFKSNKAFKLTTQGKNAGQQNELPSVKLKKVGNSLQVTVPQGDFMMKTKAWGAETFFYANSNDILLSSCEKRSL